jgi:hypothetical protein
VSFSVSENKGNIGKRRFDDIDNIRSNITDYLKAIPQTSSKIVLKGALGAGIDA